MPDFYSAKKIAELLQQNEAVPLKRLGQNFLIDKNILQQVIKNADIKESDIILEIGPGIGALTIELAKKAKKIIAIEKDKKLYNILKDIIEKENITNIQLINDDILTLSIEKLMAKRDYKIIANLPYYITSAIIKKFLESECQPNRLLVFVQKEIAQRICQKPPKMSILAISVQFYGRPKVLKYISKNSFWPIPKVDSAIIEIVPFTSRLKNLDKNSRKLSIDAFFRLVRAGFSSPRKQLASNLAKNLEIERENIEKSLLKCGLNSKQRAETLTIKDWENLTSTILFL